MFVVVLMIFNYFFLSNSILLINLSQCKKECSTINFISDRSFSQELLISKNNNAQLYAFHVLAIKDLLSLSNCLIHVNLSLNSFDVISLSLLLNV